jgi:hypothetical protein
VVVVVLAVRGGSAACKAGCTRNFAPIQCVAYPRPRLAAPLAAAGPGLGSPWQSLANHQSSMSVYMSI